MDNNKLYSVIKLRGYTMKDFLMEIHMSKSSWSKKIRGLTEFKLQEIKIIANVLSLSDEQIIEIFFAQKSFLKETI